MKIGRREQNVIGGIPSRRSQVHLAFPQGLPSIQKCQKNLQAHPAQAQCRFDNTTDQGQRTTRNIRKPGMRVVQSFVHLLKILAICLVGASQSRPTHIAIRCAKNRLIIWNI